MTSEMKSRIFTLGNKMTRNMGRKEAFIRAWAIIKAGSIEIRVAGVTFGNRQIALRRLASYHPSQVRAFLTPEPENPVDRNAVAVMVGIQGGRGFYKLGYVPAGNTGLVKAARGVPYIRILPGDIYGARVMINL
jgi:hypothetical protein